MLLAIVASFAVDSFGDAKQRKYKALPSAELNAETDSVEDWWS